MSLLGALFNPNGRIGPATFRTGAVILIAIGFATALTPLIESSLVSGLATLVGLAIIYPWVCLWSKRLHDAGLTGWLFVAIAIVWVIVSLVIGTVIQSVFAADLMAAAAEMGFGAALQAGQQIAREVAVPSAIANAVAAIVFVVVGNLLLKSQPGENQYGPGAGAAAAAEDDDAAA